AYGYDAADNLQNAEDRHGIFPLADNRLLHWRNLWNQYDGQGNLTRRREGATEQYYQYDADNRLVAARGRGPQGEFVARYGYDALGRRTGKTVTWCESGKQEETHFLWEGYRLLQVRQPDRKESYVYDPTVWWSPLARITQQSGSREGDIRWFITDLNGAPLEMTDADGSVRWSGDYGSFGQLRGQTQDSEGLRDGKTVEPQPLRYAGQYADDETGLHYNLFRYYDPTVGRFTTQDPIGLAGGINLYQYAPNPLSWVDPLGLTPVDATGYSVYGLFDSGAKEPYYVGITNDIDRRAAEHLETGRLSPGSRMRVLEDNVNYGQARGYEQHYIEHYKTRTGTIGEEISSTNRGNKYNSFDHSRTDSRAQAFKDAYNSKRNGTGKSGGKCG
ncbi:RHS repeat-associated core domain-containing protein, partial [Dickeya solani]